MGMAQSHAQDAALIDLWAAFPKTGADAPYAGVGIKWERLSVGKQSNFSSSLVSGLAEHSCRAAANSAEGGSEPKQACHLEWAVTA